MKNNPETVLPSWKNKAQFQVSSVFSAEGEACDGVSISLLLSVLDSSYMTLFPLSAESIAPIMNMKNPAIKAILREVMNEPASAVGNHIFPSSVRITECGMSALRPASAGSDRIVPTGLYPRNAENSADVGGSLSNTGGMCSL